MTVEMTDFLLQKGHIGKHIVREFKDVKSEEFEIEDRFTFNLNTTMSALLGWTKPLHFQLSILMRPSTRWLVKNVVLQLMWHWL